MVFAAHKGAVCAEVEITYQIVICIESFPWSDNNTCFLLWAYKMVLYTILSYLDMKVVLKMYA